jgi:hypothetical protein
VAVFRRGEWEGFDQILGDEGGGGRFLAKVRQYLTAVKITHNAHFDRTCKHNVLAMKIANELLEQLNISMVMVTFSV